MVDVTIDYRIVIAGILSLTIIGVCLIFYRYDTALLAGIIGAIAWTIGYVMPAPKIDNQKGMLRIVLGVV